jgi:hypothetical protein
MEPSVQQAAILDGLKNLSIQPPSHLSVRALAGTGKTSTIELCQPIATGLNVAFNRVVRETFQKRMPDAVNHTFNSLGHSIISKNLGKRLTFSQDKIKEIRDEKKIRWSDCPDLFRIMDLARSGGFGGTEHSMVDHRDLEMWREIIEDFDLDAGKLDLSALPEILDEDLRMCYRGRIDYGDQLWFPVIANLSLGIPPKIVYIDEAQDVNNIQIKLIERYARRSRVALVGDPHQAIYGFRGSVAESMFYMERALGATPYPLSVSYRCPKSVVRLAQSAVPEFEFHPDAPEGEVIRLGKNWDMKELEKGSVVLCRNNAPLISLALALLSEGIPAAVRGRDIGKSLVSLAKTIIKEYHPGNRDQFLTALDSWQAHQISLGRKSEGAIVERASALGALLSGITKVSTVEAIEAKVNALFTDNENAPILLSTIHKAKGLEWPTVYFLDDWRIPSHFAKTPEAREQERNVWYVGVTRAMKKLIFIEGE